MFRVLHGDVSNTFLLLLNQPHLIKVGISFIPAHFIHIYQSQMKTFQVVSMIKLVSLSGMQKDINLKFIFVASYRQVLDLLPCSLSLSQQDTDLSLFIATRKNVILIDTNSISISKTHHTSCIHTHILFSLQKCTI